MADEKIVGGERENIPQEKFSEKQDGNSEAREFSAGPESKAEGATERIEGKYNEILSKVTPQTTGVSQSSDDHLLDAKNISATVDEESKIQKLVDLAEARGVVYAVKVARSLQDYYALDRMHDELVDRLYDGLLAKGLIRKD